jgi:magnesium-transporting ATPase (P-type)
MVNVINGAFSFWQEYKAEKATEALRKLLPHYVRALRDGQEQRILAEELVPGDVILLSEGDHISADARLVQADELRVDQSTLTGESYPVRKTTDAVLQNNLSRAELPNLVFAGTSVAAGTGRAVVFATGMNTEFGKIANLTQSVGEEASPLQKRWARNQSCDCAGRQHRSVLLCDGDCPCNVELTESFIFTLGIMLPSSQRGCFRRSPVTGDGRPAYGLAP